MLFCLWLFNNLQQGGILLHCHVVFALSGGGKKERETKRRNELAVDSGGQIKVLGLNGIVGQMTRHRCLSAHSHPQPQKNINPPLHQPSLPPRLPPLPATALHLPQRREYFIFSNPTAGESPPLLLLCKYTL